MDESQHVRSTVTVSQAARKNVESGVLLLSWEFVRTAARDRRLDRLDINNLIELCVYMNGRTAKSWPDRRTIAINLGVAATTVSNRLLKLRKLGYILAERERVPAANNRSLMVYTFGNIDHDALRRHITSFIEGIRNAEVTSQSDIPKSSSTVTPTSKVTSEGDILYNSKSPPRVMTSLQVTSHGGRKSPPTVDSNLPNGTYKNSIATVEQVERGCGGDTSPSARSTVGPTVDVEFEDIDSSASFQTPPEIDAAKLKPASKTKASASHDATRGTRLPDEWWPTNDEFHRIVDVWDLTPNQALHIVREFKNYWLSVPGKAGRKTDWKRTLVNRLDTKATRRGEEPAGQTNRTSSAGSRKPSVNDIADDVFSYQD